MITTTIIIIRRRRRERVEEKTHHKEQDPFQKKKEHFQNNYLIDVHNQSIKRFHFFGCRGDLRQQHLGKDLIKERERGGEKKVGDEGGREEREEREEESDCLV